LSDPLKLLAAYSLQSAYAVTVNVSKGANAVVTSPTEVHTVVLLGYDELSTAPLLPVTRPPPPRRTFPAAHVAVAVT
jgi:hypothetical protein